MNKIIKLKYSFRKIPTCPVKNGVLPFDGSYKLVIVKNWYEKTKLGNLRHTLFIAEVYNEKDGKLIAKLLNNNN